METGKVQPGEFPFPLTRGPNKSRFLTWLRNHSNYLAVRGLLDYFRVVAVLIRGILINNLVLIPGFLITALVLGLIYGSLLTDWDEQTVPAARKVRILAAEVRSATTAHRATHGKTAPDVPDDQLIIFIIPAKPEVREVKEKHEEKKVATPEARQAQKAQAKATEKLRQAKAELDSHNVVQIGSFTFAALTTTFSYVSQDHQRPGCRSRRGNGLSRRGYKAIGHVWLAGWNNGQYLVVDSFGVPGDNHCGLPKEPFDAANEHCFPGC